MKRRVYVETSIVSYLTARPSRTPVLAEHQRITREWWKDRDQYDLFVSRIVVKEAGRGSPDAARRRLEALRGIEVMKKNVEVRLIARCLVRWGAVPPKASNDGTHIAFAIVKGLDYLLTWNCSHLANAAARSRIEKVCREMRRHPPVICTPRELIGD